MDAETYEAARRRLHASAFSAADDGLSDDEIFHIVEAGIEEARRIQEIRRASENWGYPAAA